MYIHIYYTFIHIPIYVCMYLHMCIYMHSYTYCDAIVLTWIQVPTPKIDAANEWRKRMRVRSSSEKACYMHTYIYTYIYVHIHMHIRTHIYTHTFVHIYVYICVYLYKYTCSFPSSFMGAVPPKSWGKVLTVRQNVTPGGYWLRDSLRNCDGLFETTNLE